MHLVRSHTEMPFFKLLRSQFENSDWVDPFPSLSYRNRERNPPKDVLWLA
jgi:hypothetical protein